MIYPYKRINKMMHPIEMKKFKYKERLRHRFISTCPLMTRYHTSFGVIRTRVSLAEEEEYEDIHIHNMESVSKKFMGCIDSVEFKENEEVLIKDDFGIHIMYD
jgi:hypothetical protein